MKQYSGTEHQMVTLMFQTVHGPFQINEINEFHDVIHRSLVLFTVFWREN